MSGEKQFLQRFLWDPSPKLRIVHHDQHKQYCQQSVHSPFLYSMESMVDCLGNEIMLTAVAARSGRLSSPPTTITPDMLRMWYSIAMSSFSALFSVNRFCGMILRE